MNRLFGGGSDSGNGPAPTPPADFPFELRAVRGVDAVSQALSWREEWSDTFSPVILGSATSSEDLDSFIEVWEDSDPPQSLIEASAAVDVAKRLSENDCDDEELEESITNPGDWAKGSSPNTGFSSVADILSGKVHPWVWVAKIPTPHPYEIPAFLRYGGWNACPEPAEHVAIWRYWEKKHGAEILCATHDIIEATVANPPTNKDDCYALAREQFSYCDDIVSQGVGTIDALAATLRGAKSWYFWWD